MGKIVDLNLLADNELTFQIGKDKAFSFNVLAEPTIELVYKLVQFQEDSKQLNPDEIKEYIVELVTVILNQDKNNNVNENWVNENTDELQRRVIVETYQKRMIDNLSSKKLKIPHLPGNNKGDGDFLVEEPEDYELFADFALLAKHFNWTHNEIINLPHSHFLAYRRQLYIMQLKESEEGREYLKKVRRYENPRKDADLGAIRALNGFYNEKEGD